MKLVLYLFGDFILWCMYLKGNKREVAEPEGEYR